MTNLEKTDYPIEIYGIMLLPINISVNVNMHKRIGYVRKVSSSYLHRGERKIQKLERELNAYHSSNMQVSMP